MLMVLTGWIMTGLLVLFMLGASVAPKLMGADVAIESLTALGWSPRYLTMIGVIELGITVLYAVPLTGLIGAVLMTGLLGGAMATHIRAESPLFTHTLFSVYLGVFMWVSLWLRDPRFRRYFSS
jgi:hypothetical protein